MADQIIEFFSILRDQIIQKLFENIYNHEKYDERK